MTENPYRSPEAPVSTVTHEPIYTRRWDIIVIAIILSILILVSIASIPFSIVRDWFRPRFVGGVLALNPLMFLMHYLRKDDLKMLRTASFMFIFTAILNAGQIAWLGTVPVVTNSHIDRLPSAYMWSILPMLIFGLYVGYVYLVICRQQPLIPDSQS